MQQFISFRWLFSISMLLLVSCGCAESPPQHPQAVFPVDGELSHDGKPAVGALVTFHLDGAEQGGTTASAIVRADGHFVPVQPDGAVGLPEGKYRLTAVWDEAGTDRLQGRYSDPSQPLSEVLVKPNINLIPPIAIRTTRK